MTPRSVRPSRPFRSQWAVRAALAETAPAPETNQQARARKLPMPGPGVIVSVPLGCLMEYLDLYQLTPDGIREPKIQPQHGPGEAILLVRHTKGTTDGK